MSAHSRPYVLVAHGGYHRVRYDPARLVRGARIKVQRGAGATVRLVPYVVHTDYDPRLGRVVAHGPLSRVLRSIDPLCIWEVTDASS